MQFREHTLDNGLQIVAECNDQAYSTALGFFVRAGARDETPAEAGVSHFLEHMAFKGTPHRSAADVNRELDELGAHSNAFTSEEQTVYYAAVLPEYQDRAVDLLADIMRPSLRHEDFDTEKQVIIEEIHKYDDQPPFGAHEKCMAAFFGSHPLGNSVLGTIESVQGLTPEAMRGYFQRRYSPGNMTLVATGNIDFARLVAIAQDRCGTWQPENPTREIPTPEVHADFRVVCKSGATQQYIVQIAAGPSATDQDRFACRILAAVIGDDTGSRFYWDLIEPGLAEYAGMGPYEFQGAGIVMTYLSCAAEQTGEVLRRVQRILKDIQQDGITADELELAKSKISSHLVRQSERPGNRLFSVGNGWIQRGQYQTVPQRLANYQQVDLARVRNVIDQYPLAENATVAIGPLEQLQPPTVEV